MRTLFRSFGPRAQAGLRTLAGAAVLAWPALAAAQEAASSDAAPVSEPPVSQLPVYLNWLGIAAVVAALCFGAAIAWSARRPAGSAKTWLGGAAAASIVLTWAVAFILVGGMPQVVLLTTVVGNVVVFIILSGRLQRPEGPITKPSPAVEVPRESHPEPARPVQTPPVPVAERAADAASPAARESSSAPPGTVFISYRRIDSSDVTGRIYDRLVASHGRAHVYKDVDSIPLGTDFRRHVADLIERSDCVLAVIGRQWLETADAAGRRRLDDPTDLVRIEIEAALARGVPVIPLLVQGASMPDPHALPEVLRPLAFRNGMAVRADPDFHRDLDRLDEQLRLLHATGAR